jgi:putative transposase
MWLKAPVEERDGDGKRRIIGGKSSTCSTIHLESRRVDIAGLTVHPNEQWMQQIAPNVTMDGCGALRDCRYLLHDRDPKYSATFCSIIETARVKTLALPARGPNLKEECLSKIILFGKRSLRRAVHEYVAHYHRERNHQEKSNVLLYPRIAKTRGDCATS